MTLVNYEELAKQVIGCEVDKPLSGTLSGHAAGEPFDKHIYSLIKEVYPDKTFRQFEYLNDLYSKNPDIIGTQRRRELFDSPTVMFLLSRGKDATDKWSIENPFEEKQNDTADILVADTNYYEIIDIKTRNMSKKAQPPNIISSFKLAQVCAKMIDNEEFDSFEIIYFGIDWSLRGGKLVCEGSHFASLFKSNPADLYINWAAGMQIQFQIHELGQDFNGTRLEWAREYLKHYVKEEGARVIKMKNKFVGPFEKYIK